MSTMPDDTATTVDAFLGGQLMLEQPANGYRAGLDAILLAAACPIRDGETAHILDCGAGAGAVGLSAAVRMPAARVVLVERDPILAALALANARRNGVQDRVRVITADLTQQLASSPDLAAMAGTFDAVLANPPYFTDVDGTRASNALKDRSHAMARDELEHWIRFAAAMARAQGTLTLIHRSEALPTLLSALGNRFGAVRIWPIQSRTGAVAARVLISGIKGSRAPLKLLPPLIIHADGPSYSADIEAVLRDGARLHWPAI